MTEGCPEQTRNGGPTTGPLAEQYRPRTWADVVGQDKAVQRVQGLVKRGLGGRAFWLAGQSGTGKTTIARLIAAEVADELCIQEVDAAALTVGQLRDLEREMGIRGWGERGGRAYVVNEAHALRKDVIRQLLVLLERLPGHVVVVFTTTTEGQDALFEDYDDASPLLSRCLRLDLARRDLARPFAERAKRIAEREGLDGQPIERYVNLPDFFKNEAELRNLWSNPDTRAVLLHGLSEKGFGSGQLAEMQKIIDAEKSDLFDVLAYVAYAVPTLSREERAARAKGPIGTHFNNKQQTFLEFVLAQYVKVGVHELDKEKLSPLLKLKYNNAIADAIADLGKPEEIGKVFAGFQKFLYEVAA